MLMVLSKGNRNHIIYIKKFYLLYVSFTKSAWALTGYPALYFQFEGDKAL